MHKCILCKKPTINCDCDKKFCICGHSLGYHRFIKMAKPDACLHVFWSEEKHSEVNCPCNKFIEVEEWKKTPI